MSLSFKPDKSSNLKAWFDDTLTSEGWFDQELAPAAGGLATINGILNATLGNLTAASTASLSINGQVAATLGALTLASASSLSLNGIVNATLGNITATATASLAENGTLNATLGNLTAASTASLSINGQVAATLSNLTLNAAASLSINGQVNGTLDNLMLVASGDSIVPAINGMVNTTLDGLACQATATMPVSAPVSLYGDIPGGAGYVARQYAQPDVLPIINAQVAATLEGMSCVATVKLGEIMHTARIIPFRARIAKPAVKPVAQLVAQIDYELEEFALMVASL